MLGDVFYWLLNMSILATIVGIIVWLLTRIRWIPKRVSVFLWIIPFVRMLVPFGFHSRYSLMGFITKYITRSVTVTSSYRRISQYNSIGLAESYDPIVYKTSTIDFGKIFSIGGIIWLTVSMAILLTLSYLYCTTMKLMKDAEHLDGNLYVSDKIDSPAVYGIFKRRIIIPVSYKERELKYILRHEQTHIRRGDNLWRLLGFLAVAIHWFNPFSWLFLKAFLADLELACDEMAIKPYALPERKEYARALLDSVRSKNVFVSAFGGAKVRTRIENVMSYKKMTLFSLVCMTTFVLAIFYTLLTNSAT